MESFLDYHPPKSWLKLLASAMLFVLNGIEGWIFLSLTWNSHFFRCRPKRYHVFIIRAWGGYTNILFNSVRSIISIPICYINEMYNLLSYFFIQMNRFIRHPGYCGFFIWATGSQVMLCNPICIVAFVLVTWRFFSSRIRYPLWLTNSLWCSPFTKVLYDSFHFWERMLSILTSFTHQLPTKTYFS